MFRKFVFPLILGLAVSAFFIMHKRSNECDLPVVAVANFGSHSTLEASIDGLKSGLEKQGFADGKTIKLEIADVGFDQALIPQMIAKLRGFKPKVMVVKTTPVAQCAKGKIKDIPLVFCDITDPVEAGLLEAKDKAGDNITGSSDQESFQPMLAFAKQLFPNAQTVGLLYGTAEGNDAAMVALMRSAAAEAGLAVLAIPIDQTRDIPVRMQELKRRADFIYVGTSDVVQPALPVVSQEAQKMGIPILVAGAQEVRNGLALASFGVNYEAIGARAANLVAAILKGADIKTLPPSYPTIADHERCINKKLAEKYKINIPEDAEVVG